MAYNPKSKENLRMFSKDRQPKNKNGRKKGVTSVATIINRLLSKKLKIQGAYLVDPVTGQKKTMTGSELIAYRLFTIALDKKAPPSASITAIKELIERFDGAIEQKSKINIDGMPIPTIGRFIVEGIEPKKNKNSDNE